MKKNIIAAVLSLTSGLLLAKEIPTSQPPFNIPDGYSIYNVGKDVEFDELKIPGYAAEAFFYATKTLRKRLFAHQKTMVLMIRGWLALKEKYLKFHIEKQMAVMCQNCC